MAPATPSDEPVAEASSMPKLVSVLDDSDGSTRRDRDAVPEDQVNQKSDLSSAPRSGREPPTTFAVRTKCIHKSDRICVSDLISHEVTQGTITEERRDEVDEKSSQTFRSFDSVHSGESVYKIYTFEAEAGDPQVEKCITFWENLLKHDLRPIKCTVVRQQQEQQPGSINTTKYIPEELLEEPGEEKIKEQSPPGSMCLDVLNEVKRQHLEELQVVKNNCYVREPPGEYYARTKRDESREIKALNAWRPKWKAMHDSKGTVHIMREKLDRIAEKRQEQTRKWTKQAAEKAVKTAEARTLAKERPVRNHIKGLIHAKRTESEKLAVIAAKEAELKEKEKEEAELVLIAGGVRIIDPSTLCRCGCKIEECTCAQHEDVFICDCGCLKADCICDELIELLHDECDDPCVCPQPELDGVCPCIVCDRSVCVCKELAVAEEITAGLGEIEAIVETDATTTTCPCICDVPDCICTALQTTHVQGNDKYTQTDEVARRKSKVTFEVYCPICGEFHYAPPNGCAALVDKTNSDLSVIDDEDYQ